MGPTLLSWDVLINGAKGDSVTISNKGTGAFTVSGVTPALPAQFVLGALPGVLNPNTSAPLTVTFNAPATPPLPDGVLIANALVNITPADNTAGTDVGHNKQLSVSATTQALEVMLLLDTSGSMSWDPLGNSLPVPSNMSRWHELVDAVNPISASAGIFWKWSRQIRHCAISSNESCATRHLRPSSAGRHPGSCGHGYGRDSRGRRHSRWRHAHGRWHRSRLRSGHQLLRY